MKRREFIAGLGVAAWPLAGHAQQSQRLRRIAMLGVVASSDVTAFAKVLAQAGWIEGRKSGD